MTVMGLQQTAWVLREVAPLLGGHLVTTDWRKWGQPSPQPRLLLWEAFVTGAAKAPTHMGDALTAAAAFAENETALDAVNAVTAETPISLVACVALWAGIGIPVTMLRQPVLVLKPSSPFAWEAPSV